MPPSPEEIAELLRRRIPDAEVRVELFAGDDHFKVEVISPAFRGKSRLDQHRMVYEALGDNMRQAIHALTLKTISPKEAS